MPRLVWALDGRIGESVSRRTQVKESALATSRHGFSYHYAGRLIAHNVVNALGIPLLGFRSTVRPKGVLIQPT